MIKMQRNAKRLVSYLCTGSEKGKNNKTGRRYDLLINDKKCDPLYDMEARLLHLIIRLREKIERKKCKTEVICLMKCCYEEVH